MVQVDTFHAYMATVDISKVDLNLLVVPMHCLTRRVYRSGAAARLTQSTLSHCSDGCASRWATRCWSGRSWPGHDPAPRALVPALQRTLADVRGLLEHEERLRRTPRPARSASHAPTCWPRFCRSSSGAWHWEAPRVQLTVQLPAETDFRARSRWAPLIWQSAWLRPTVRGSYSSSSGRCTGVLARRGHPAIRRGWLTLSRWLSYPISPSAKGSDRDRGTGTGSGWLRAPDRLYRVELPVGPDRSVPYRLLGRGAASFQSRQCEQLGLCHAGAPIACCRCA